VAKAFRFAMTDGLLKIGANKERLRLDLVFETNETTFLAFYRFIDILMVTPKRRGPVLNNDFYFVTKKKDW
jgi:hypothetical protein